VLAGLRSLAGLQGGNPAEQANQTVEQASGWQASEAFSSAKLEGQWGWQAN
jgi:hypothetical protein